MTAPARPPVLARAPTMIDWLLLLNDDATPEDAVAALRASIPPPWGHVVILAATQRWRPFTSGVPLGYRGERQRALHEVWAEQEDDARARLAQIAAAVEDDADQLDVQFVWGDPVSESHRLAHDLAASTIVYPVPARWRFLNAWPGSFARRLARNAPCSVLLARAGAGQSSGPHTSVRPLKLAG